MRYPDFIEKEYSFPDFYRVEGVYPRPVLGSIESDIKNRLQKKIKRYPVTGKKIGIGVGSRGIRNIALITKVICQQIRENGGTPFIIPAMGSHGGATHHGQEGVLQSLGIDANTCQAEILSSMDVNQIGRVENEIPVYYSSVALTMDYCICINRIKAHTKFKGKVESGLMKMLCIGLGKHQGAIAFHTYALKYGFYPILEKMSAAVLAGSNFKFGVGIVENAYDETMCIELIDAHHLVKKESELLLMAKKNMPGLPVKSLDVLIINQIGKNISGSGMDPNITGRAADLMEDDFSDNLTATRLGILNLSPGSKGNGLGMGNADFITEKVFSDLDYEATIMNVLTSVSLKKGFIPIRIPNDQKVIQACFTTIGPKPAKEVESIIINNTLDLKQFYISEFLVSKLENHPHCKIGEKLPLPFDQSGNLKLF
jgi:hypothetical protein